MSAFERSECVKMQAYLGVSAFNEGILAVLVDLDGVENVGSGRRGRGMTRDRNKGDSGHDGSKGRWVGEAGSERKAGEGGTR